MVPKWDPNRANGPKRALQGLQKDEQKPEKEKHSKKDQKLNLSQQGNGKRAQQESTVEQRVYICSMHPRPQSKDEKLKNISKIIHEYSNTCNPCSKNMIWIHYSLEQRHHILYKESYKKHVKILLKDTPKWPQMAPFGSLGATLEPARHQGRKLHPSLSPEGLQMKPIWSSMGTLRSNKSTEFDQKSSENNGSKKQHEKDTIWDPPKP